MKQQIIENDKQVVEIVSSESDQDDSIQINNKNSFTRQQIQGLSRSRSREFKNSKNFHKLQQNENSENMINQQKINYIYDFENQEIENILHNNNKLNNKQKEFNSDEYESQQNQQNINNIINQSQDHDKNVRNINLQRAKYDMSYKIQDPRIIQYIKTLRKVFDKQPNFKKLNLILDIDETLLNSNQNPNFDDFQQQINEYSKKLVFQTEQNITVNIYVTLRPGVQNFLEELSQFFKIYAYSHGKGQYVLKVLDILDPKRKFINREIVFINNGQVNSSTKKSLEKLQINQEMSDLLKCSIIVDDQILIWEDNLQKNVIGSKKFVPFFTEQQIKEKHKEAKQYIFPLIYLDQQHLIGFKIEQLKYYIDQDIQTKNNNNLLNLRLFLLQIAIRYYHEIMVEKNDQVDIRNLIKNERNLILHKKKIIMIEFYTDNISIQQTLIQLIQLMGGKIILAKVGEYILEKNLLKADYVVAEQNLFSVRESYFKKIMSVNQNLNIIKPEYISDCWFACKDLGIDDYILKYY